MRHLSDTNHPLKGLPAILAYLKCSPDCLEAMRREGLPVTICADGEAITTMSAIDHWLLNQGTADVGPVRGEEIKRL